VLIGMGLFSVLVAGKRRLQVGIVWAVFLLAFGLRRFFLTNRLEFHPAEILLWFLAALVFLERKPLVSGSARFRLPLWMIFFILFWPIGWVLAIFSGTALDQVFNQFKPFLVLPLVFWLVWRLLQEANGWRTLLTSLFLTSTLVAVLGLLEYVSPGVVGRIPGFTGGSSAFVGVNSFLRARYSFYGAPTATFMMVIAAPLGLALWHWAKTPWNKWFIVGGFLLQAIGVYIGGYRSIWLALGAQVVIFLILNYGPLLGVFALIPVGFVYESLPREALIRMASLFSAVEGQPLDSSAVKRIGRVEDALARLMEHPLGTGWASSGWTHNDLLQIGLSVGALGALVFIAGYLWTVFRLVRRLSALRLAKDTAGFRFGLGIFLSFIGSGFLYVSQGITWQIFLVLPAWLSWAMAACWLVFPPVSDSPVTNP
jgi:hypothetical protein